MRDKAARIRKFLGWGNSRLAQDVSERNSFASGVFGLGLAVKLVKFSGGGIGLHLSIPVVVRKRMQERLQFRALLQREFLDGRPDFSNRAHGGKLSAKRKGVNKAICRKFKSLKMSREGGDVGEGKPFSSFAPFAAFARRHHHDGKNQDGGQPQAGDAFCFTGLILATC